MEVRIIYIFMWAWWLLSQFCAIGIPYPHYMSLPFFFFLTFFCNNLTFLLSFVMLPYFYRCDFNLYSPPKIINIKPKKKISALKKLNLNCCCSFPKFFFWFFVVPWTIAHQAYLFFTISLRLLKLMPIESLMPPNIIFGHPLLLNFFQHWSLFQWISSSHKIAEILDLQLQHQSFQWNIQDWFLLGLTGLISLQYKELSRGFSSSTIQKQQFFGAQSSFFLMDHLSHLYITTGKDIALTRQTFVEVMPLLFNTLSRFLIAFLPRSKHLLILWLQSPSTVILNTKKIKYVSFSLSICH